MILRVPGILLTTRNTHTMIAQLQSQRQQCKIIPQQIELLNLFFLSSMELQQRIKNELEENPFLDLIEENSCEERDTKLSKDDVRDFESSEEHMYDDRPDYQSDYQNYFDANANINLPIASIITFKEDAKQQLNFLKISETEKEIAGYIIDILTPQGFMDRQLSEVADDISFHFHRIIETEAIQRALTIVQSLDPIGIGVFSIRECLLLQLHNMNTKRPEVMRAILLIKNHYNDLIHRQFEKLHHALRIDDEEMKVVLGIIGSLKFHPVKETHQHDPKQTIIPDLIISHAGSNIHVSLNSSKAGVFVNQSLYNQLADNISLKDKAASQYVKSKLTSAQWFVNAIQNRENTMMCIMKCIVAIQHEYFMNGDIKYLKPMVLKNVSEKSGFDIATISRITSNKYADTPFGIIYLKKLFSEGIADKMGEVVSNKVIQSVIGDTIESENKKRPYTDQALVNILCLKGYNIARRTVSKYRKQMKVPIAQIRAVWA
jgi:RNA polymerase sigma-54 factor